MLPETYLPVNRRRSLEEWLALAAGGSPRGSRLDEFAPFLGERPQGTFAGDAPPSGSLPAYARSPTPQPVLPSARPISTPPIAPAPETSTVFNPNDPRYRPGERYEGLSPLGRKLAELRARQQGVQYETDIRDTGTSFEVTPPATRAEVNAPRNRLKQALAGALYGAAMAGQGPTEGAALRALGGAATGAAAGGISPRLMEAFNRQQKLNRVRGEVGAEQETVFQQARIAETQAQAAQRIAQPELEALRIQRQIDEDKRREDARRTRSEQADEANEIRREGLKERERHNRAVEGKTGATEEITVAGRKFKVTPSTAARILEARTQKPNERTEAGIEAELEHEAGMDHLAKRKGADEQASELRKRRAEILSQKSPTVRGKKEFEAAKEEQVREIDRQIAEAERESTYRQTEADQAFDRRNKAKAKAGSTAPTGGTASEEAIRERALQKGLDPDVAVQRARARGLLK